MHCIDRIAVAVCQDDSTSAFQPVQSTARDFVARLSSRVHWFHTDMACCPSYNSEKWKTRSERRKHCALAVVRQSQKFSSLRRPPSRIPRALEGQNLIS